MQYVITKQIAVEAETPEEAVSKINEGQTISLNVTPRPQPNQAQGNIRVGLMPQIPPR